MQLGWCDAGLRRGSGWCLMNVNTAFSLERDTLLFWRDHHRWQSRGSKRAFRHNLRTGKTDLKASNVRLPERTWSFCYLYGIVSNFTNLDRITQVGAELPVDSDDADNETKTSGGSTLLSVFERGCDLFFCNWPARSSALIFLLFCCALIYSYAVPLICWSLLLQGLYWRLYYNWWLAVGGYFWS